MRLTLLIMIVASLSACASKPKPPSVDMAGISRPLELQGQTLEAQGQTLEDLRAEINRLKNQ